MNDCTDNRAEIYAAIEKFYVEYKALMRTKEYRLGLRFYTLLKYLRKLEFRALISRVRHLLKYDRKSSRNKAHGNLDSITSQSVSIHMRPSGKTVIYTCISGPYDEVKEPFYPEEDVDYVIFTDQPKARDDTVWQYHEIPSRVKALSSYGIDHNVYFRAHPQEFFPNHKYSIYLDGQFRIISDISAFVYYINDSTGLALHAPSMGNYYDEAKEYLMYGKIKRKSLTELLNHYKEKGFPADFGIFESGFIVTDLTNSNAKRIYQKWWDEYMRWGVRHNQIVLSLALWETGFTIQDVGHISYYSFENPKLQHFGHKMNKFNVSK